MIRGPLPSCAGETRPPLDPSARAETAGEKGGQGGESRGRAREEREEGFACIRSAEERGSGVSWGEKPCLRHTQPPPSPLPATHTQRAPGRCGYVAGLSGLLTGLPPFITAGSLVLLLGGTAALGTVSPTSCNDGSLYMATGGAEEKDREERDKAHHVSENPFNWTSAFSYGSYFL